MAYGRWRICFPAAGDVGRRWQSICGKPGRGVWVALPIDGWLRLGLAPQGFQAYFDRVLCNARLCGAPSVPAAGCPLGSDLRLKSASGGERTDLDALLAIDTAAFGPLWRLDCDDLEAVLEDEARISVAVESGRVVGFQITYLTRERSVHLARLAVMPERQSQGIGGALLDAELATYREAGPRSRLTC